MMIESSDATQKRMKMMIGSLGRWYGGAHGKEQSTDRPPWRRWTARLAMEDPFSSRPFGMKPSLGLDWTDRTGSNRSEKKTLPNSHASARTRHRTIEQRVLGLGQLGGREGRERKRKGEARKGEDRRACELWSEVR